MNEARSLFLRVARPIIGGLLELLSDGDLVTLIVRDASGSGGPTLVVSDDALPEVADALTRPGFVRRGDDETEEPWS